MSDTPSESAIVREVADRVAKHISRKVIADLQRMTDTLSGEDTGLKTTWDEICVQVQHQLFGGWDSYDETVRAMVAAHVEKLPLHEREVIWFQTDAGGTWDEEETTEGEGYPVYDDDLVDYITREYVYAEAGRWSNARIRAYLEGNVGD